MTSNKSGRELEQVQQNLEYNNNELRVFIADLLPYSEITPEQMTDRMEEVENLVNTYGWVVILKHIQKKSRPDYNTYIWAWKLEEIMLEMQSEKANILIFGNILKTHQIYKINESLRSIWAKAWDRVDLILKIFERHAKSTESLLQIELASIRHMWPRIFGMWMELSKQWWGIWTRWKWETNTEIMKRYLRRREITIKKDLEKFKKVRRLHRNSRTKKGLTTIWIVGYTNAWKSSLLNSLTNKKVLTEDKLFATLWTSVGKMWIKTNDYKWKEILLNDTIWFIKDLPPNLIDAFSSTLEDSIESDLLFYVVDASDFKISEKIKIVDDILDNIWATQERIYVFNKIDKLSKKEVIKIKKEFSYLDPIFVSTYSKNWLEDLKDKVANYFR